MSSFSKNLIRLGKNSVFSLLGTTIDMLVLWLCSDYVFHGYVGEYIISPCISFEFGVITNFFVSRRFVWQDRVLDSPRISLAKCLVIYNLSCIFAFCIRVGISLLLYHWSDWDVVPCNMIAMLISGILNFVVQNSFVFRQQKK